MENFFLSKIKNFLQKEDCIKLCKKSKDITTDNEIDFILDYYINKELNCLSQQEISFIQNNDSSKWIDYLIYRYKFNNYKKLKKVPEFPLYLLIEPTSICNLRCKMCFQIDKSFSSNKEFMGKMDFGLFIKIIDEAYKKGTRAITLASRGEPTLNKEFGNMIEYCSDKFYEIKINTNAILLDTELCHRILKNKIGILVFSIDAYDIDGYRRIRKKDKFLTVVKNIINFNNIKEKYYPNSQTITRAHGVKSEENFDIAKFYEYWKNITDEVTFLEAVTRWDTYNNEINSKTEPCSVALDRMYIWYDGTCNPCDADYKSHLKIGKIQDSTIEEIWNSKKFKEFRNIHFSGNRSKLFPCNRCEL